MKKVIMTCAALAVAAYAVACDGFVVGKKVSATGRVKIVYW